MKKISRLFLKFTTYLIVSCLFLTLIPQYAFAFTETLEEKIDELISEHEDSTAGFDDSYTDLMLHDPVDVMTLRQALEGADIRQVFRPGDVVAGMVAVLFSLIYIPLRAI